MPNKLRTDIPRGTVVHLPRNLTDGLEDNRGSDRLTLEEANACEALAVAVLGRRLCDSAIAAVYTRLAAQLRRTGEIPHLNDARHYARVLPVAGTLHHVRASIAA